MGKQKDPDEGLIPSWVGNQPFPPDKKRPFLLPRDLEMPQIFGEKEGPIFSDLFFSTDQILLAEFTVAPGGFFTVADVHAGDEVYYCKEGKGVVFNPETGQSIEMKEGDAVLIPKETRHVSYNFSNLPFVVVCAISPQGWSTEDGMGTAITYSGPYRYYQG